MGLYMGWYGTVLDSAMACAVSTRSQEFMSTTLEFKINITRPIPMEMEETSSEFLTTQVVLIELIGANHRHREQKTYATGSTTCFVFRISQRIENSSIDYVFRSSASKNRNILNIKVFQLQ